MMSSVRVGKLANLSEKFSIYVSSVTLPIMNLGCQALVTVRWQFVKLFSSIIFSPIELIHKCDLLKSEKEPKTKRNG